MLCSKVVLYYSVLGGYVGLVALLNGFQLCSHFFNQRTVAALPLLCQRYMFVLSTLFCFTDIIGAVPEATTFFLYSLRLMCKSLGQFLTVVFLTQWAYETSRNAYSSICVEQKSLPKWPFVWCCLQTFAAFVVANFFGMYTNRQKYTAIAYIVAAFQFLLIAVYTAYFFHRLVLSLHTSPQSELFPGQDIPTRIRIQWRFVVLISTALLILATLLVVQGAVVLEQDSLFYDESQACVLNYTFLEVFRNILVTIASVWAHRKMSSSKYLVAPTRTRPVAVSALSNVLSVYPTGDGNG
eukprot:TRINITY_DN4620_c0_g3_i3.p1 TRINITY_DN4620_c0_g3~~TRINITY_DN4620_c0_g3_i3.p1  ORF type:complete len:296 (-),score=-1.09 TRINITY_DN4620_c0_g3_i3:247-1134(-)